jgi:hypothetical protein
VNLIAEQFVVSYELFSDCMNAFCAHVSMDYMRAGMIEDIHRLTNVIIEHVRLALVMWRTFDVLLRGSGHRFGCQTLYPRASYFERLVERWCG